MLHTPAPWFNKNTAKLKFSRRKRKLFPDDFNMELLLSIECLNITLIYCYTPDISYFIETYCNNHDWYNCKIEVLIHSITQFHIWNCCFQLNAWRLLRYIATPLISQMSLKPTVTTLIDIIVKLNLVKHRGFSLKKKKKTDR